MADTDLVTGLFIGAKISTTENIDASNMNASQYNKINRSYILFADEANETNYIMAVSGFKTMMYNDLKIQYDNKIIAISGVVNDALLELERDINNINRTVLNSINENNEAISGLDHKFTNEILEINNNIEDIINTADNDRLYMNNVSGSINARIDTYQNKTNLNIAKISGTAYNNSKAISGLYHFADNSNRIIELINTSNNIISNINKIKQDVASLSGSVKGLKTNISNIDNKLSIHDKKIDNIQNTLSDMDYHDISELNNKINELQSQVEFLLSRCLYNITYNLTHCTVKIDGKVNPEQLQGGVHNIIIIPDIGYEYEDNDNTFIIVNNDMTLEYHCVPKQLSIIIKNNAFEHCTLANNLPNYTQIYSPFVIIITPDDKYELNKYVNISNANYNISGNTITVTPNGRGDVIINKIMAVIPSDCYFVDSTYINDNPKDPEHSLIIISDAQCPLKPNETYEMRQVPYVEGSPRNELYLLINKEFINVNNKTIINGSKEYILSDAHFGGEYTINNIEEYDELYYKCLVADNDYIDVVYKLSLT